MSKLQFNDVSKSYVSSFLRKKISAVSALSLEVDKGEVFGLVGPNGAGKSTSIKMLLGLIRPDNGQIILGGKPSYDPNLKKTIGYLPENPYLYDHLTLAELLGFSGTVCGLNSNAIKESGSRLINKLDLRGVENKALRTFSKGMLQRAGICIALLHSPSVIVLDEPMSGLDPIGRGMVFDLIMELKDQGKTIFFCSHILNDVERLCDRIGLLNKGRLIAQFDQKELLVSSERKIFLEVTSINEQQKSLIESLDVKIRHGGDKYFLAADSDNIMQTIDLLRREQIQIIGSRESWTTLEDLFMQKISEEM